MVMLLGGVLRAEAEPSALVFPPMTGSVVDAAQMLDSQTTVRLARLLSAHEKATGERVVVVTLADLQGTSIEEFGSRLGDAWGLGLHGKDDSVLLVVYRDKRRLNDAQASLIIDMLMTPEFDDNRFAVGIERGTRAVIAALGGQIPDYPEPTGQMSDYDEQPDDDQVWLIGIVLTLIVLGIVIMSVRRGGATRPARERVADRSGGRFGGGGASGNW
ncbi:TPM domain-containing protein [Pseudomonas syringae]|uniref:TPM domain-containing protein n=1 Tax=Pseudomonas syringae TaxID=317 RepID=UPI0006287376|nr:TPM domain-containing protein [Pseudomonas syringae]